MKNKGQQEINLSLSHDKVLAKIVEKTTGKQPNKRKNRIIFVGRKLITLIGIAVVCVVSCLCIKHFGFNKGIDFSGGIVVEAKCDNCDILKIAKTIEKDIKTTVQYQKIDSGFLLKTTASSDYDAILSKFAKNIKNAGGQITLTDFTSPQMSASFIKDSVVACIFAFICLSVYIIARFNIKFSICAILTLVMDLLITTTFISVAHIEVCLITLTAILTIIGYGINDKIVVFDRIRENLYLQSIPVVKIVKNSVKSVLLRSILTSATTIIASLSLFFFKDRSIYNFELTIIFGIAVSTLSSLIIAPNLLLALNIKHLIRKTEVKDPMWYAS